MCELALGSREAEREHDLSPLACLLRYNLIKEFSWRCKKPTKSGTTES